MPFVLADVRPTFPFLCLRVYPAMSYVCCQKGRVLCPSIALSVSQSVSAKVLSQLFVLQCRHSCVCYSAATAVSVTVPPQLCLVPPQLCLLYCCHSCVWCHHSCVCCDCRRPGHVLMSAPVSVGCNPPASRQLRPGCLTFPIVYRRHQTAGWRVPPPSPTTPGCMSPDDSVIRY